MKPVLFETDLLGNARRVQELVKPAKKYWLTLDELGRWRPGINVLSSVVSVGQTR